MHTSTSRPERASIAGPSECIAHDKCALAVTKDHDSAFCTLIDVLVDGVLETCDANSDRSCIVRSVVHVRVRCRVRDGLQVAASRPVDGGIRHLCVLRGKNSVESWIAAERRVLGTASHAKHGGPRSAASLGGMYERNANANTENGRGRIHSVTGRAI